MQISASPGSVSRVSIRNDTDYTLGITVAGAHADDWMDLGWASHNHVTAFEQVVDQGKTWTFRVAVEGQDGGQFSVSRDDLAASNWTESVPAAVEAKLRTAGVSPDPLSG